MQYIGWMGYQFRCVALAVLRDVVVLEKPLLRLLRGEKAELLWLSWSFNHPCHGCDYRV